MQITPQEIHIWSTNLAISDKEETTQFSLLSVDEKARAARFRFPVHKKRFIAAHAVLRQILSLYLSTDPKELLFSYTSQRKPFLPEETLQFNLSHSDDLACIAVAKDQTVGIDIEKITEKNLQEIAARFFSKAENQSLANLPDAEKILGFYRIWSRKEALLKAHGTGLSTPLDSFSVSADDRLEQVELSNQAWSLTSFSIHPDFAGAIASNKIIQSVSHWHLFGQIPMLDKQTSY